MYADVACISDVDKADRIIPKLLWAAEQLEAAESILKQELAEYKVHDRIIANKCRTQEIRSSAYRKYQLKWKNRLVQKTGFIEENI